MAGSQTRDVAETSLLSETGTAISPGADAVIPVVTSATAQVYARLVARALSDAAIWVLALSVALVARYDFSAAALGEWGWFFAVLVAAEMQVIYGLLLGLYRRRYAYGSFEEVRAVVLTVGLTTASLMVVDVLFGQRPVPLSVPLMAGFAALAMMSGARYAWRLRREHERRPDPQVAEPVIVFGAGDAGRMIVRSMMRTPDSPYRPVALLDDDPAKQSQVIHGVPVRGTRRSVARVAKEAGASTLIFAVPSAEPSLLRDVTSRSDRSGVAVKVLPHVAELVTGTVGIRDIRDLDMEDFLGRRPLDLDTDSIAGYLTGKRVLVTGAGGSIGSELCRQLSRYGPAELMMLDRDESGLHATQLSLDGHGLLDTPNVILADIRDAERIAEIFAERRPEVIFHAAALKHLPLLEQYPYEAMQTNVKGTLHVLEAARDAGVERFVNISTDKAANPQCVLGYSKRITERLTAWFGQETGLPYVSVRFGNVLGSRGSVLHAFAAQAARGGPITVTHPDVTRYFMLIPEACQLVIQAGAIGDGGEVMVLDMGEPVRIADLAERIAAQQPRVVQIKYTGLRPGEKLHEELVGTQETQHGTAHPLMTAAVAPAMSADDLGSCEGAASGLDLLQDLAEAPVVGDPAPDGSLRRDSSGVSTLLAVDAAVRSAGQESRAASTEKRIYLSPPDITDVEKALVMDALDSGWVAPLGPHVDAFEEELAAFVGVKHAVALSSGTAALHLGLLTLGVGPGDDVLVPTLTFGATAFAVTYTGARPVFIDAERSVLEHRPRPGRRVPGDRARSGRRPSSPWTCSAAPPTTTGCCRSARSTTSRCWSMRPRRWAPVTARSAPASMGRAGVFSFNGNKIITTSGGGMLVTDDAALADRVRYLSTQARQPVPWYEHTDIGFNYRMSNVLAAIGRGQLQRLPGIVERRREIQQRYAEALDGVEDVVG